MIRKNRFDFFTFLQKMNINLKKMYLMVKKSKFYKENKEKKDKIKPSETKNKKEEGTL